MHVFIAGICGTFMAGVAMLARELGHQVSGCDVNVYPPMSDQLAAAGIEVLQGYEAAHLAQNPDVVVVGNALSRGNPLVEALLESDLRWQSGPEWLHHQVLVDRHVLAVSGTHGKTTTSSMLAWILDQAGFAPGFLIGGIPSGFGVSARLGQSQYFVIEADEYDTAFFDKRSKFVHYHPKTLIINNLEFDHADIFPDLSAIQRQFHHLIRTVPGSGRVVIPHDVSAIDEVLGMGLWSSLERFSTNAAACEWVASSIAADGSAFRVNEHSTVRWGLTGHHNVTNGLAAIAAAAHVGIDPQRSTEALSQFGGVKRRLEWLGAPHGIDVYDDFAHHPTAIASTLQGLRAATDRGRVFAVIEPRSNTMRMGVHREALIGCVDQAEEVLWFQPEGMDWDIQSVADAGEPAAQVFSSTQAIIDYLVQHAAAGDKVVIMSNGGFEDIHRRLLHALAV